MTSDIPVHCQLREVIRKMQLCQHSLKRTFAAQLRVSNKVMSAVDGQICQKLYFIDGPGGTGKTFVYNTLAAMIRGQNKVVKSVATSGIAAKQVDISRSAHSTVEPLLYDHPQNHIGVVV